MIDLTPIFQAIIALLAALVTYKLIPWIKSKTTKQQQENLAAAAKIAVYAAQQLYGASKESNEAKLDYCMRRLYDEGFNVDTDAIRAAVEKAVYELKPTARFVDIVGRATDDGYEEEPEEEAEDAPGVSDPPLDTAEDIQE